MTLVPILPTTTIVLILVGVMVLSVAGDLLGWMMGAWNWMRGIRRDRGKAVAWPQELRAAAAQGLVRLGSELVVGLPVERGGDGAVRRFSIAAADCGEKAGTVLRVVGMDEEKLVVVRVDEI